jgi:hypothetical protein
MKKLSIFVGQQGATASKPPGRFASFARLRRARRNRPSLFVALVCLLASCELTNYTPPVVTPQTASARKGQHRDLTALREGRTLFVSRCIECHTLPAVSKHTAAEWPALIDEMAGRANLKPEQRVAVLAYILAAREL